MFRIKLKICLQSLVNKRFEIFILYYFHTLCKHVKNVYDGILFGNNGSGFM